MSSQKTHTLTLRVADGRRRAYQRKLSEARRARPTLTLAQWAREALDRAASYIPGPSEAKRRVNGPRREQVRLPERKPVRGVKLPAHIAAALKR